MDFSLNYLRSGLAVLTLDGFLDSMVGMTLREAQAGLDGLSPKLLIVDLGTVTDVLPDALGPLDFFLYAARERCQQLLVACSNDPLRQALLEAKVVQPHELRGSLSEAILEMARRRGMPR